MKCDFSFAKTSPKLPKTTPYHTNPAVQNGTGISPRKYNKGASIKDVRPTRGRGGQRDPDIYCYLLRNSIVQPGHTGEGGSKNPDFGRTSLMEAPLPYDLASWRVLKNSSIVVMSIQLLRGRSNRTLYDSFQFFSFKREKSNSL